MENNIREYDFMENALKKGRLFNIPVRHWIEAFIFGSFYAFLISFIPFVSKIKWVLIAMVFLSIAFLHIKGWKNRSITQIIFAGFKYFRRKRRLHLRTPEYKRNLRVEDTENESFVEFLVRQGKLKKDSFIEKYSTK